jgi:hypothetical protein
VPPNPRGLRAAASAGSHRRQWLGIFPHVFGALCELWYDKKPYEQVRPASTNGTLCETLVRVSCHVVIDSYLTIHFEVFQVWNVTARARACV